MSGMIREIPNLSLFNLKEWSINLHGRSWLVMECINVEDVVEGLRALRANSFCKKRGVGTDVFSEPLSPPEYHSMLTCRLLLFTGYDECSVLRTFHYLLTQFVFICVILYCRFVLEFGLILVRRVRFVFVC